MVHVVHLSSKGVGVTYIFPSTVDKGEYTAGLKMYDIFKEYKLEHNNNYQQYFSNNQRFKSYLNLTVNTNKVMCFQKFLEIENTPHVDNLFQGIMYMICNILTVASQNNTNKSVFETDILNLM